MQIYLMALLALLAVGCGKKNKSHEPPPSAPTIHYEELNTYPDFWVDSIPEAKTILRDAVYDYRLHEFHNTRWFIRGSAIYLFTTRVIDDQTYRMVVEQ